MSYQLLTASTTDGLIDLDHLVNDESIAVYICTIRNMLNNPALSWIDPSKIVLGSREGSLIYGSAQYVEKYKDECIDSLVLFVVNNPTFSQMFPEGISFSDYLRMGTSESTLAIFPLEDVPDDDIVQFEGLNFFKFDFLKRMFSDDRLRMLASQLAQYERLLTVDELQTKNIMATAERVLCRASNDIGSVISDSTDHPELYKKLSEIQFSISQARELAKKLGTISV